MRKDEGYYGYPDKKYVDPAKRRRVRVKRFLELLRSANPDHMTVIYTQGSCYHLYTLLKFNWPTAEAYYNLDHVIVRIDDDFYDITGPLEYKREGNDVVITADGWATRPNRFNPMSEQMHGSQSKHTYNHQCVTCDGIMVDDSC